MEEHGSQASVASDQPSDPQIEAVADKLQPKFAGDNGPLSQEDVTDVVRDTAKELRDAPVQTFVPLITENKASSRLRALRMRYGPRESPGTMNGGARVHRRSVRSGLRASTAQRSWWWRSP
jgi:hypothetical protein